MKSWNQSAYCWTDLDPKRSIGFLNLRNCVNNKIVAENNTFYLSLIWLSMTDLVLMNSILAEKALSCRLLHFGHVGLGISVRVDLNLLETMIEICLWRSYSLQWDSWHLFKYAGVVSFLWGGQAHSRKCFCILLSLSGRKIERHLELEPTCLIFRKDLVLILVDQLHWWHISTSCHFLIILNSHCLNLVRETDSVLTSFIFIADCTRLINKSTKFCKDLVKELVMINVCDFLRIQLIRVGQDIPLDKLRDKLLSLLSLCLLSLLNIHIELLLSPLDYMHSPNSLGDRRLSGCRKLLDNCVPLFLWIWIRIYLIGSELVSHHLVLHGWVSSVWVSTDLLDVLLHAEDTMIRINCR